MTPRWLRVLVCAELGWLITIAMGLGCASLPPDQPIGPAQVASLAKMDAKGPSDVHVMEQGLILDLHMDARYMVCVELETVYRCLSVQDLRDWLAVWQNAQR